MSLPSFSPAQAASPLVADLWTVALVVVLSAGTGLVFNHFSANPVALPYRTKVERLSQVLEELAGVSVLPAMEAANQRVRRVGLHQMQAALATGQTLVVDARPEIFHRMGRIPQALLLPREQFGLYYERQRTRLENAQGKPVIVYCQSEHCEDSVLVADVLLRLGFADVAVFTGGWNEWKNAGLSGGEP